MRYLGKVLLYSAFIYIGLNLATIKPEAKYLYYIVTIIVLIVNLFYDLLKYNFNQIMKSIAFANPLNETRALIEKLERRDLFKGLKNSLIIPKILLALDAKDGDLVLRLTKEHDRFLHGKADYLLIMRYSNFKAYCILNRNREALTAYHDLQRLKESNLKSKHMNLLFNWDQIEALHFYQLKKYRQALVLYEAVSIKTMNPRERVLYYSELAHCYDKLSDADKLMDTIQELKSLAPTSPYTLEWTSA